MDVAYPLLIQEDVARLQAAEKAARDKARTDRLRLLRLRKSVSRASARRRRCWAIVCELLNVGGSAIAKAAWRRCWRHRSDVAHRSASRRRPGRVCRRRCGRVTSAGGTALSARHLAHRLWHRCDFQAVSAAQDQAERPHHRNSPTDQAAFKK